VLQTPDGYRFDQGTIIVTMLDVFRQTLAELDTSFDAEGLDLRQCKPGNRVWFGKNDRIDLSNSLPDLKVEMNKREGQHGFERYLEFLRRCQQMYNAFVSQVAFADTTSWAGKWTMLTQAYALHPLQSMWSHASSMFTSESIKKFLVFESMYMGMNPDKLPSTFGLWHYAEVTQGIWYPIGGIHKLVQVLVGVGERMGVRYHLGSGVRKILLSQDGLTALGIQTENGETILADVVVNNADMVYAYDNLLPNVSEASKALHGRSRTCSTVSFFWALKEKVSVLKVHNTFLASDYHQNLQGLQQGLVPEDPTFYVLVPSRIDPTAAPDGCDCMVVIVPVGHLPSLDTHPQRQDWTAIKDRIRQQVLKTISDRVGLDIGPLILHEQTNDPETWQARFNLHQGSIVGFDYSLHNTLFRPSYLVRAHGAYEGFLGSGIQGTLFGFLRDMIWRPRYIRNLYMVGSNIHPGAGLPLCLAGARTVTNRILREVKA
jgi:phytoene desaturase (3,4-didehydrolycopene-forming)